MESIVIIVIIVVIGYFLLMKSGFLSVDQEERVLLNIQDKIPGSFGQQKDQIIRDINAYNEAFKGSVYRNNRNFAGARNLLKSLWAAGKHLNPDAAVDFRKAIYDYNFSLELILGHQTDRTALNARIKKCQELRDKIYGYLNDLKLPL